jgi:hypothetical protein
VGAKVLLFGGRAAGGFLDVRISVLKKTFGRSFSRHNPAFHAEIDQHTVHVAVWWIPRLCMLSQTAGSELSTG